MDLRFYTTSVVFVLMFFDVSHSSKYDKDNWVDPDDIMNYDRASKTMIPVEKAKKHRNNWLDPDSPHDTSSENNCYNVEHAKEVLEFKKKLAECQNSLINTVNCDTAPTVPTVPVLSPRSKPSPNVRANVMRTTEMLFMKRFVSILLDASGLAGVTLDAGDTRRVNVAVEVDSEQLVVLQRFGEDDATATLGELNDVMSVVLQSTESGFYVPLGWLERFGHFFSASDWWYRMMPYACTLLVLAMLVLRRPALEIIATFLVLVFALSYQWTYEYLIKMAEINQYMDMKRFEDVPPSCLPATSVFDFFRRKLLGTDADCRKYHVAQMMPAALVVTPTLVLAEMLTAMLVHPMGKLGGGIASFSAGILDGLTWYQGIVVLALVSVLITFLLAVFGVVVFGGRLRLPIFLGGFELSGQQNAPRHIHAPHRVQEMSQLPAAANSLPPNPVNVNIYLDSAMFSGPREAVQQLTLANVPQRTGIDGTLVIDACLVNTDAEKTDLLLGNSLTSDVLALGDALTSFASDTLANTPQQTGIDGTLLIDACLVDTDAEKTDLLLGDALTSDVLALGDALTEANASGDLIILSDTTVNAVNDDLAMRMLAHRIYKTPEVVVESRSRFLETIEQIASELDSEGAETDGGTWRETEPDLIVNTDFITSIERILLETSIEEGGDSDCREAREGGGTGLRETDSRLRGAAGLERSTDAGNDIVAGDNVATVTRGDIVAGDNVATVARGDIVAGDNVATVTRGDIVTGDNVATVTRGDIVAGDNRATVMRGDIVTGDNVATVIDALRYAAGDCAVVNPPKVVRKVSEDSSDGSGDFVKL